jgi:hypothetical protein
MEVLLKAIGAEPMVRIHVIPLAAPVYDIKGEKVGHVRTVDADALTVERGLIVLRVTKVRLADIERCVDGRVHLRMEKGEVFGGR